jgi:sialate O-acetylesterase
MVLQKGVPVPVRGWADPSEKVTVEFAGQQKDTVADASGNWTVGLDPLSQSQESGEMRICGKNTVSIKNILVGDVWLASGQSNMAMRVREVQNAAQEMAEANYPNLRVFTVEREVAPSPKNDCVGTWLVCDPKNVGSFSAAGYFFVRELHQRYKLPIGLINSSVGSSSCQAWTPREVLTADPSLPQPAALAPENYRDWKTFEAFRNGVYDEYSCKDPGVKPECLAWAQPECDTSDWKEVAVPGNIESQGMNIDGAVWFRKDVELPADWAGQKATIYLGPITDNDIVYINGQKIGATQNHWRSYVFRSYAIPTKLLRPGRNVVAVRIFNAFGNGGFHPAYPAPLKIYRNPSTEVLIPGKWKCKVELALKPAQLPFAVPSPYSIPSAFFNAMICPLTKFPLKGFVWYQGESNAGAARQHDTLFPAMIQSWRKCWGDENLPFYFVQLASYRARESQPSEGALPRMRESQMKTLALHDTGMALTIDIGDPINVHPRNKQEVGRRLARWAMRDCYGDKDLEVSGPLYASSSVEGDKIRIRFTHTTGGLKVQGDELKGFAIAASDKRFVWAKAVVEGDTVVVSSPSVNPPSFVRYAWANNPDCNLYNAENLPASPFRTDTD